MKSIRWRTALALLALIGSVRCGGGGRSAAPTAPTTSTAASPTAQQAVSADLPNTVASPGLYQDGRGTYPPGDEVYFGDSLGSSLFVRPLCSGSSRVPRELNLVLPQGARDVAAGRLSKCVDLSGAGRGEAIFLHVPNLLPLQTGAVVGARGAPPNATTNVSIFLYLNVDSNGDGTISLPMDDSYNIRWQKGIYLKQRSETVTTTVYELTSLATQFGPDLSCSAELILRNTPLGEISKGFHCLPLVLTVTVHK